MWLVVLALVAACSDTSAPACGQWQQIGGAADHTGTTCVTGQMLDSTLATVTFDPFVALEEADSTGDLTIHYQTPLLDGGDVYMLTKSGTYTRCERFPGTSIPDCYEQDEVTRLDSQIWNETAYEWKRDGSLAARWTFATDWKPLAFVGFEPVFQPVIAGEHVAIPGAEGSIWIVDRESGDVVAHVQPFGVDTGATVAGGLTYANGTIYYDAWQLDTDATHGWLVAVDSANRATTVDFATLVPDAPAQTDLCYDDYTYNFTGIPPLPWPPLNPDGSVVMPPQNPCGPQLPGLNAAPAVGPDGTIFTVSAAAGSPYYSYIVAVAPDLTPKWDTSLRGLLADGCGVLVPRDDTVCSGRAQLGIDPYTGMMPAGQVSYASSASPVALPDGGVLYGSFTGYNSSRGHLIELDPRGFFVASYDFGWDITPAVAPDGTIAIKDNHYNEDAQGHDLGPYFIAKLDRHLQPMWWFQSANTQSCTREPDGTVQCVSDHPDGFEWCINAPAIDAAGTIYVNSEDGTLYAIDPNGDEQASYFLDQALGAAYTPVALDHEGRVFALNSGVMTVIGQ
jgi:outer membrane protein assembly factor BamB